MPANKLLNSFNPPRVWLMFRFFTSSYRFGLMSFQPERHAGQGHRAAVSPRRIRRGRDFGGRPFRHPSRRPLNTGEVSAARRPYHAGVNSYFEFGFKKDASSRSATGAHPHAVCIHWRRKVDTASPLSDARVAVAPRLHPH